jgi:hypothetical protein
MRTLSLLFTLILAMALSAVPAFAQGSSQTFTADLNPLNSSGSSGTATVVVNGNQVTVTIEATGLSPNLPHAQHIHIGGQNICPTEAADDDGDGLINTVEGQPFYGPVQVSLTTEGDVSADSGLAVERFPVADADGTITYSRTFPLPDGVTADDIPNGVIVQHGISELFEDPTQYDGEPRSSLNPDLPLEATMPSNCGELVMVDTLPKTGTGVVVPTSSDLSLALGAAALSSVLALGGLMILRTRKA